MLIALILAKLIKENSNSHDFIMCNANCINAGKTDKISIRELFLMTYFYQIKQPQKYFDYKGNILHTFDM